jgi:hypothetical protein
MKLGLAFQKLEVLSKLLEKGILAVPHRLETAALFRTIQGKGSDNQVAAGLQYFRNYGCISTPVLDVCQEVEDGPIMPEFVMLRRQAGFPDIRHQPGDGLPARAQPLLGLMQRSRGNIQEGNMGEPMIEEVVDEGRCASTNINNAGLQPNPGTQDEIKRQSQMRLVPANFVRGSGGED